MLLIGPPVQVKAPVKCKPMVISWRKQTQETDMLLEPSPEEATILLVAGK